MFIDWTTLLRGQRLYYLYIRIDGRWLSKGAVRTE
jgi:hypothetical protein